MFNGERFAISTIWMVHAKNHERNSESLSLRIVGQIHDMLLAVSRLKRIGYRTVRTFKTGYHRERL